MKKYIAEALGTFMLTLVVALSLVGSFPVSTPVLAVLVVGLFVYAIGHVSGCHINPALTIGLWSIKKINSNDALKYIIAQFIGAGIAFYVFLSVNHGVNNIIVLNNSWTVGFAEFLGMIFYGFFVAAVFCGRISNYLSGIVVAGSLLVGIAIASLLGSNGLINPAVAFGIGSFNLMYILGPAVGSILGMQAYKYFL